MKMLKGKHVDRPTCYPWTNHIREEIIGDILLIFNRPQEDLGQMKPVFWGVSIAAIYLLFLDHPKGYDTILIY